MILLDVLNESGIIKLCGAVVAGGKLAERKTKEERDCVKCSMLNIVLLDWLRMSCVTETERLLT